MKFLQTIFVLKPNIFSLLQLSVSLGSIIDYMLIQHSSYILAKFRYKNNLVGVREASCLALKYFDHRKHPILVSTTMAENCPQVAFKYHWCHSYRCLNLVLNCGHWLASLVV